MKTTPSAISESEKLNSKIAELKEELAALSQQWEQEKKLISGIKEKKDTLEKLRFKEEEYERKSDYNQVAQLRYKEIPELKKEIEELQTKLNTKSNRLLQEEVDENLIAHRCIEMDRNSCDQNARN